MGKYVADPLAILRKRKFPGIVMLNGELDVTWVNDRAAALMGKPHCAQEVEAHPLMHDVVRLAADLLAAREKDDEKVAVAVHLDGDHTYGLRATFMTPPDSPDGASRMVLVYIDTVSLEREVDFDAARRLYHISRREQDVVRMLYYGKSNRDIADLLFISEYTVKDHIKAIMSKMDAKSRSEVLYKLSVAA